MTKPLTKLFHTKGFECLVKIGFCFKIPLTQLWSDFWDKFNIIYTYKTHEIKHKHEEELLANQN